MDYLLHILVLINIYIIVGVSMNLVMGYTGLISLVHAGFFGIGAYAAALLSVGWNVSILLAMPTAVLIALASGMVVGYLALRVQGDFFVIVTFGFQVIIFHVLNNWQKLTNGPLGIAGIPRPEVFGYTFSSNLDFFFLTLFFALLVIVIASRLANAPFGKMLQAIREDEIFARSLGINVDLRKNIVFTVSAGLAASGGVLYAHYITFIDPTSFTVVESIFILSIVIVGGAGRLLGPVLGVIILVSLPEALRLLDLPANVEPNLRQIIYGAMLVAFMMFRPQGIWGDYSFGKESSEAHSSY